MIEILNIIALIFIPIFAVIVGQRLQIKHQKRNDKMQIFKILMTHRIFGWTNESVQALNLIDIVFADDEAVRKQMDQKNQSVVMEEMKNMIKTTKNRNKPTKRTSMK